MILVTGGAGYIGSHIVKSLLELDYEVLVLDNLSTGHKGALDTGALFFQGDIRDEHVLNYIFQTYPITAVMHFAGSCYVGESMSNPFKYYNNNVSGTLSLLKQMLEHKVSNIVFSSSCAVYGTPKVERIAETTPTKPINPYGHSKLMIEQIIRDLSKAHDLQFIFLRYFNVAGADPSGRLGEYHEPETHLIPNVLLNLLGKNAELIVYGKDYATEDGTCIRDFVHVMDLVTAHILALQKLLANSRVNEVYNVGSETGYSIKKVIQMGEKITGKRAKVIYGPRREGDPPKLVASSEKIQLELGWKPQYSLKGIIETAWNWHSRFPSGYRP